MMQNIITLDNGYLSALIAPYEGGSIRALRGDGGDWNILRDTSDVASSDPRMLSCFPMVPFVGRVRNSQITSGGQIYHLEPTVQDEALPIHGYGWRLPWEIEYLDRCSIVMHVDIPCYDRPTSIPVRQTVRLMDASVKIDLTVENTSAYSIPIALGLHPYFALENEVEVSFCAEGLWKLDQDMLPTCAELFPLDCRRQVILPSGGKPIDAVYSGWDGVAFIRNPSRRRDIRVLASPIFRHIGLYTPPDFNSITVEPLSLPPDGANLVDQGRLPDSAARLNPGSKLYGSLEIAVLD